MAWKSSFNRGVRKKAAAGTNRGVALALEHIQGVSVNQTPIEEGNLRRSHDTSTEGTRGAVNVDAPYAVPVHEDMTARHDAGTSAKFLELAFASESKTAGEIIARELRGEL